MKIVLSLMVMLSFLMTSCTKDNRGADDLIPHQNGIEDNPNGGGGNNTVSVPDAVLSVFHTRFPDATRIEWKQLSNGNYKAEFLRGTIKWQVIFTSMGTLIKQEHN